MASARSVAAAPDGRLASYGWVIIAVCTFGISTGPAAFAFGSAGQFIGAFHDEFGWDRTQVSFGLLILTGMTALSLPFIGRLIDRYGARRVLVPSLVLFAACLAAIPLFVRELWQLHLVYVLMGTVAAGTNSGIAARHAANSTSEGTSTRRAPYRSISRPMNGSDSAVMPVRISRPKLTWVRSQPNSS